MSITSITLVAAKFILWLTGLLCLAVEWNLEQCESELFHRHCHRYETCYYHAPAIVFLPFAISPWK